MTTHCEVRWRPTPGLRVVYDGDLWEVVSCGDSFVTMTGERGSTVVSDRELAEFGRPADVTNTPSSFRTAELSLLDEKRRALVLEIEQHVLEVQYGYKRGSADYALPGEPRPEYHPDRDQMERYASKSRELAALAELRHEKELRASVPKIRRWCYAYRKSGPGGLLKKTWIRHRLTHFGRVDQRWVECAIEEIEATEDGPHLTNINMRDRINVRFRDKHDGEEPTVSQRQANGVFALLDEGTYAFSGATKTKRGAASRPRIITGTGLRAKRPGEILLFDTSPLDVIVLDANTGRFFSPELTIAICLATRSVVGLRLTDGPTKAIDVAMLLFEVIHPRSNSHTGSCILPYGGVPTVVEVEQRDGGLPAVTPDTIIVDHGKTFLNELIRTVCLGLGISIQPARIRTGSDKGVVESIFGTIRTIVLERLEGYKGPDVYSRGLAPERDAIWFSTEVEEFIRRYFVEVYHPFHVHPDLVIPGLPGRRLTPNEAFTAFAAEEGHIDYPISTDLLYEFLPVERRVIRHDGIRHANRYYNSVDLNDLAYKKCPDGGNGWPIRYNPDDVRHVFVEHPRLGWVSVPYKHADDFDYPISEEMCEIAKKLFRQKGKRVDPHAALLEMEARWRAGFFESPAERRAAARNLRVQMSVAERKQRERVVEEQYQAGVLRDLLERPPLELVEGDDDDCDDNLADELEVDEVLDLENDDLEDM